MDDARYDAAARARLAARESYGKLLAILFLAHTRCCCGRPLAIFPPQRPLPRARATSPPKTRSIRNFGLFPELHRISADDRNWHIFRIGVLSLTEHFGSPLMSVYPSRTHRLTPFDRFGINGSRA